MIRVKLNHPDAKVPVRNFPTDAGADLFSVEEVLIPAGSRYFVNTGISIEFVRPYNGDCPDFYFRIAPRSGMAFKNGIDVLAGVCDESYRGDIKVGLYNTSDQPYKVNVGDKIAQIIQEVCVLDNFVESSFVDATARGASGFGSSGA